MAKIYYTNDEAMEKLGMTEDEIKSLVRDGKLREFRDAGKVHFKTEDIDKLAAAAPPVSQSDASAESSLPGLSLSDETDMSADSGEITLEPVEDLSALSGSGSSIGLAPESDDASSASDAGLISLEDSQGGASAEVTLDDSTARSDIRKDDTIITSTGVSVFDDELESEADPAADTVLTASASDQVALEGIGSGSGLLDLTREADDTSLGAELLDEILPGGGETRMDEVESIDAGVASESSDAGVVAEAPAGYRVASAPVVVDDPYAPAFTGIMVVATIMLTLAGAVAGAFVQGAWPSYLQTIYANFMVVFGGSFVLAALVFGVGFFICRSKAGR
jgi:hypothetical protein